MAVSLCCFNQPLCSGRVPSTSLEVHSNICHIFSDYSEQGRGWRYHNNLTERLNPKSLQLFVFSYSKHFLLEGLKDFVSALPTPFSLLLTWLQLDGLQIYSWFKEVLLRPPISPLSLLLGESKESLPDGWLCFLLRWALQSTVSSLPNLSHLRLLLENYNRMQIFSNYLGKNVIFMISFK